MVLLPHFIDGFDAHAIAQGVLGEETNEGSPFEVVAQDSYKESSLFGFTNCATVNRYEVETKVQIHGFFDWVNNFIEVTDFRHSLKG